MRSLAHVLILVGLCVAAAPACADAKKPAPPAETAPTPVAAPAEDQGPALVPKTVAVDTNKDGTPDRWEYYEQNQIARIEADTNHDGTVDEWVRFADEKVVKVEKDTDYDGQPDRWVDY